MYHCTRARTRPSISPMDVTQFVILERALSLSESSTGSLSPVGSPRSPPPFNFEPSSPDDVAMVAAESPRTLPDMPAFFSSRRRRGMSESDSDTLTRVGCYLPMCGWAGRDFLFIFYFYISCSKRAFIYLLLLILAFAEKL